MRKKAKRPRPQSTYRADRRNAARQHAKEAKVPFRAVWQRAGYRSFGKR